MATTGRYSFVAMMLHWIIALGVVALLVIGLVMKHAAISPMLMFRLFQLHKSIGITVLIAAVVRLGWRLTHRPPALPAHMSRVEVMAAEGMHRALYGMMLGLPLLGWAVVSASPFSLPTVLFGVVRWPDLPGVLASPHKAAIYMIVEPLHKYGAWLLLVLLVGHVAALIRHQFIQKDRLLQRMLPTWLVK